MRMRIPAGALGRGALKPDGTPVWPHRTRAVVLAVTRRCWFSPFDA